MIPKPKSGGPVQDAVDEEFTLRYNRSLVVPIILAGLTGMVLKFILHRLGVVGPVLMALSAVGLLWLGLNEVQWRKARRNLPVKPLDSSGRKV